MTAKIKVFNSTTDIENWLDYNCNKCEAGYSTWTKSFKCSFHREVILSSLRGGYLSKETASKIGYQQKEQNQLWRCLLFKEKKPPQGKRLKKKKRTSLPKHKTQISLEV